VQLSARPVRPIAANYAGCLWLHPGSRPIPLVQLVHPSFLAGLN